MDMTFTAIEKLPDSRERVLATGLTLAAVKSFVSPTPWGVIFRQEH